MMGVPGLSCFVMGTPVLDRLILGMDCGYPQRMWARLNSSNSSSFATDRLCDQIDAGDMAAACVPRLSRSKWTSATKLLGALLKQVISTSEPVPDEVQRAIENSEGGLVVAHSCSPISSSSSSLRHVYGGYLSA